MVANSLSYSFTLNLMAFLLYFMSTLFSRFIEASTLPSLTNITNSSSSSPPGSTRTSTVTLAPAVTLTPTVTGCELNCTPETVLLIVNNQTNNTRTSTIKNTNTDLVAFPIPTNTNSAGTQTVSISIQGGPAIIATFPTPQYGTYASTYGFCGTLPTVISGTSTCLTIPSEMCLDAVEFTSTVSSLNSNNGVFTFPSHPPIHLSSPLPTVVDVSLDPRGMTYTPILGGADDDQTVIQPLFPDLSFWSCGTIPTVEAESALETALFLTVTSTSHETGLATPRLGPAAVPSASSPASSLAQLLSSEPAPIIASVSRQDDQSHRPAPDVPLTSAPLASVSPPPGAQPASTDQPAQNKQPTPNNSPSPTKTVPHNTPGLDNEPALSSRSVPNAQQISSTRPANDQPVASQPAHNPNSPESAPIVPITVASTNAQGSVAVSTTLAGGIAVLQTSTNIQGQTSVFTTFSPLTTDAPVTLIPQVVTSTNAKGSVILATSNVVPVPIVITSTNPQGKAIITTSRKNFPVTLNPTASPIAFIPTTITATNAQGITTVITGTAAIIPVVASSTNPQGNIVLSSSLLTAAATASTNIVVSLTNAQGSITSSITQVSAVIFTTTNVQGSQILITLPNSPITTAFTTPPRITIGTQIVIPNSQSQYMIDSQTLTPGGAITVSGTPISLAPSASALVIGTNTQQLVTGTTTLPTLTIGTLTVSPNSLSQYIISSQTLTPGGIITLSGTLISLAPSAIRLIIGSNTIPLGSSTTLPPPLTIGSQDFTANSATQYIIGSQTLAPGGAITVSGTRVSLALGDTAAVVGTSTEGLGTLITAGLGSGPGNGNGNGTGTAKFTGGARASGISGLAVWLEGILMLLGLGMVMGL